MRYDKILGLGIAAALSPMLAACNAHPLEPVKLISEQEHSDDVAVSVNRDVDILFVIDNSGSMAEEQATLARNFGPLIEQMNALQANYRIAVTTTDNGHLHPSCSSRDGGRFQIESCLRRHHDFDVDGENRDLFEEACASICDHEDIDIRPTTTFFDPEPKVRPWIESINGVTNLPEGISPVEAFECLAPQGLAGCGFEAPLESMRLGLTRATRADEPEFGFLRPGAILAVVFVTDEADCSARYDTVTAPWTLDEDQADRSLWSEENRAIGRPTSEICWFAGVECEEGPDGTKECWAVDKAADGSLADSADDAVLHPLDRYVDFLDQLEQDKQTINPDQQVLVGVLAGVPAGYDGGSIHYSDGSDPDFRLKMGIGPGCSSANGEAAPPVRLAEFADAFFVPDEEGQGPKTNLYSVCDDSYAGSMEAIAYAIRDQVKPPCVEVCVADADRAAPGLQHTCQVEEEVVTPDGQTVRYPVPPCVEDGEQFAFPGDADVCYRSLTDAEHVGVSSDDMSDHCIDQGWNLELGIERRGDAPAPSGARVKARCSVSRLSEIDCPTLKA